MQKIKKHKIILSGRLMRDPWKLKDSNNVAYVVFDIKSSGQTFTISANQITIKAFEKEFVDSAKINVIAEISLTGFYNGNSEDFVITKVSIIAGEIELIETADGNRFI